jgi:transposase
MRKLLDGLFHLVRTGCQWRHLPPPLPFPPWRTVYGHMCAFLRDGVWESIFATTSWSCCARALGGKPAIIDTQRVKTTESGGPRGWDAAKRLKGTQAARRGGHGRAVARYPRTCGRHSGCRWPRRPAEAPETTLHLAPGRVH